MNRRQLYERFCRRQPRQMKEQKKSERLTRALHPSIHASERCLEDTLARITGAVSGISRRIRCVGYSNMISCAASQIGSKCTVIVRMNDGLVFVE